MSTIRFDDETLKNIAKIQLDYGGISKSDAVRVAIQVCASGKPAQAVVPQMVPPKDYNKFLKTVERNSENLVYIAETGLPQIPEGASLADQEELRKAREKFRALDEHARNTRLNLEQLKRMVACLPASDVARLKDAVAGTTRYRDQLVAAIANPNTPERTRKNFERTRHDLNVMLEWADASGLCPAPKAPANSALKGAMVS